MVWLNHISRPRLLWPLCAFLLLVGLSFSRFRQRYLGLDDSPVWVASHSEPRTASKPRVPPRRKHVAIATSYQPHLEVWMTVAWPFRQVLGSSGTVQVYAKPLIADYASAAKEMGIYDLEKQGLKSPDVLFEDINDRNLFGPNGGMIDIVVLGTCEIDLGHFTEDLKKAWNARPDDEKFVVVCIVHNAADRIWMDRYAFEWSASQSLRLVTISEHVQKTFKARLRELADIPLSPQSTSLLEFVPVDIYYCVAPLPNISPRDHLYPSDKGLSHVAILGSFQSRRRDYHGIMSDLEQSLRDDPSAWGYIKNPSPSDIPWEPDVKSSISPFKLHMIGSGHLEVPKSLVNVVSVHKDVDYPVFYQLARSMDVILPAFVEGGGYFDRQASSAIHSFVQSNVPMLTTARLTEAYKYVDDDRIIIRRPHAVREIDALRALRTGSISHVKNPNNSSRLLSDVHAMVDSGWKRSLEDFAEFKSALWKKNSALAYSILDDKWSYRN